MGHEPVSILKVETYVPNHAVDNAAATNNSAHWHATGCTIKLFLRNCTDIPVVDSANVITNIYWKLHDLFIVIPERRQQEVSTE
jgi:hypothetical protein